MDFCAERGLCVGNTYFELRSLHNYIMVARGQGGVRVKSMIDLVVVKDIMRYVQDVRVVRVVRGRERSLSDHHVVLVKRLVGT